MTTGYCYDDRFLLHTLPGHPESAGRLDAILATLRESHLLERMALIDARPASTAELGRVHTHSYIAQVERLAGRGGGYLDPDTYVNGHSYQVALLAAGGLIALTEATLDGLVRNGMALVRPPGHHALGGRGMGFCIFNNIAVAAQAALARPDVDRVMIVDFDVHHGNGTQDSFEGSPDVLFVSTHQYPFYPGTGWLDEIGKGEGKGTVVNIPLPAGVGDAGFDTIFQQVIRPLADRYDPQLILVSAGFDAHWSDPLAMMALSLSGYAGLVGNLVTMAEELCDGRLVLTLEGGYDHSVLSNAILNTCHALLGDDGVSDPIGPSPYRETDVSARIREVMQVHRLAP